MPKTNLFGIRKATEITGRGISASQALGFQKKKKNLKAQKKKRGKGLLGYGAVHAEKYRDILP